MKTFWAVMYGGRFDGLAVLVDETMNEVAFPELFNLERDVESHDYQTGEHVYERTDRHAIGYNVSKMKQQGIAFTPKVLEPSG